MSIFVYHSVHPEAADRWGPWEYACTPQEFEADLEMITQSNDVRSLTEVVSDCVAGKPPKTPTAVITFDDGFRDNLTRALPILERYDAPATVYVATGYLDGPAPYEYQLAAALSECDHVSVSTEGLRVDRRLPGRESRKEVYERLRSAVKFADRSTRSKLLDALEVPSELDIEMLSTADIETLANHPLIDIGAHGHQHIPLTVFESDGVAEDLRHSKRILEEITQMPVTTFSYPYGDHSPSVVDSVRNAGFESAVTTEAMRISGSSVPDSRFRLPRVTRQRL